MLMVPPWPRSLGIAASLPQIGFALALLGGPAEWRDTAIAGAMIYAALTLAFLGGSWWGIAAGAPAAERRRALGWLWVAAVLPVMLGFGCLLGWVMHKVASEAGLVMMGSALLISAAVEDKLDALAPQWWPALRIPLAIALGTATLAAALS